MSLADRILVEYGGVGGRVAGARHPHRIPRSNTASNRVLSPKQAKKIEDANAARQSTREQMRKVAIGESRRPLKTIS
jgi:hypothetical protein